jgi:hypothetical protein
MSRILMDQNVTTKELDVIKRRLFAFGDIMFKHDIGITDVRNIKDTYTLTLMLNELTRTELETMFY